ncbi:MAG: alkaline phosphatase family protein [Chthoniobacterales bacterium]|nr:alkaline phosphatase family protein [Chthoniobacterales bacterium]
MPSRLLVAAALFLHLASVARGADDRGQAEHVVVVVWDGMRPDQVTEKNAPTLFALGRSGVVFKRNHAAYPSSTNVNGAVLATGVSPGKNGIIANQEFRPAIDPHKAFDTSDFPALDGSDPRVAAQLLKVPTIAEILQAAGHWTAVAGSKPVAQFFDRARTRTSEAAKKSTVIYRGKVLPAVAAERITSALGPFPRRKTSPNDSEDDWTTSALTNVLWREEIPKFSLLWLSEPDLTTHETALGAPAAMEAIKRSDRNLAKLLAALKAKDALTKTDIFVVSDHGFSTVDPAVDVAAQLRAAGLEAVRAFDGNPRRGQILVVSLGGSVLFYVVESDPAVTAKLLDALQRADFAGVILTREKHEGTFTFAQAHLDAPGGPDVIVACRWSDRPNEFGIAGQMTSDVGRSVGHGSHSTMSRHDMHNILIASGPDFRRGWESETPSGNIDLAPTILWLLGMKAPHPMQGRVLREAMADQPQPPAATEKNFIAQRKIGDRIWRQHLRAATVGGVTYILEGNGSATPLPNPNPPASSPKPPADTAPHTPAPPDRR